MDFIDNIINYFRKPKKETTNTSPEGTCPVCWGHQEYDGKIRKVFKDKQIDVKNHRDSYIKVKKFVVEKLDGVRYRKAEIETCPTCGKHKEEKKSS